MTWTHQGVGWARCLALANLAIWLAAIVGCASAAPGKNQAGSHDEPEKTGIEASLGSNDPGIDLRCIADRIRKPPAPFHWSYRKIALPLMKAEWEADVTPNSIRGTFIDRSGAHAIRGVRSDKTSWDTAVMILTGPLPESTFALLNNSSTVKEGAEYVNGQSTTKYSIDTSRDTPPGAALIRNVLGPSGLIKGVAWVTREGCPIKFALDVVQDSSDDTVQKEHYDANVTQR